MFLRVCMGVKRRRISSLLIFYCYYELWRSKACHDSITSVTTLCMKSCHMSFWHWLSVCICVCVWVCICIYDFHSPSHQSPQYTATSQRNHSQIRWYISALPARWHTTLGYPTLPCTIPYLTVPHPTVPLNQFIPPRLLLIIQHIVQSTTYIKCYDFVLALACAYIEDRPSPCRVNCFGNDILSRADDMIRDCIRRTGCQPTHAYSDLRNSSTGERGIDDPKRTLKVGGSKPIWVWRIMISIVSRRVSLPTYCTPTEPFRHFWMEL